MLHLCVSLSSEGEHNRGNALTPPEYICNMGDPACYRDYCPACDAQLTITDGECPDCGTRLESHES